MPSYTYKEGECYNCGQKYNGLICDEQPQRNICSYCVDPGDAVAAAKSLRYFGCQEYFDRGLGQQIRTRGQRNKIMRERGLVCMGDDYKYLDDVPLGEKVPESAVSDEEWGQIWHDEAESKQ
jgi:hypothetical protein